MRYDMIVYKALKFDNKSDSPDFYNCRGENMSMVYAPTTR